MSCSHSSNCPLFAQFAMEPSLAIWKKHFCDGEYAKCSRYQLSIKGEVVPIALMPNGKMLENKVKSKEEMGGTALFNAILKGRASMVKSMIDSKMSSSKVTSTDGSTPLMAAASIGNLEIVNILLEFGCNPFATNKKGLDALSVAEHKKFPDCAKAIKDFMLTHESLKKEAIATKEKSSADEAEEMKGIVGLLKKLNPFSRK